MNQRTWFITGVSSGFGRQLTDQLLKRGDRVIGTVRDTRKVTDLLKHYPEVFHAEVLEITDPAAIRAVVERSFAQCGRIDVIISNAGYGLFGAAEELTDEQVEQITATNLLGPIHLIRAALPHLRAQGGGRVIQISSCGGQVAFPGNSLYHASKWGIEGFVESVAQEVASFGIGMTIVEPGGARTEFRYGSAQVANLTPIRNANASVALALGGRPGRLGVLSKVHFRRFIRRFQASSVSGQTMEMTSCNRSLRGMPYRTKLRRSVSVNGTRLPNLLRRILFS